MRRTLVWMTTVIAGCGPTEQTTSEPVVRDSAGIRIVEYRAAEGGSPMIGLSPDPLYYHGSRAGDYQFSNITEGALLSDGSAVVADGENNEVIAIAPDGSLRSVIARPGQGPGEVRRVRSLLALGGDSLLVEDDGNSRLSLFVGDTLVRSTDHRERMDPTNNLRVHGRDHSGGLLMSSQIFFTPLGVWQRGYMVRVHLEEGAVDTVAVHDFGAPARNPVNPFAPYGRVRASAGEFIFSRSDKPEVMWRRPDGSIRQIVRWQPERTYPTLDDFTRFTTSQLERVVPLLEGREREEFSANIGELYQLRPDEPLPLFSSIYGDDAGRVWMSEYIVDWPTEQSAVYTVIASDGGWLGTIRLPWEFRFFAVRGGRVLGVVRDEHDIQTVVVHELMLADQVQDRPF